MEKLTVMSNFVKSVEALRNTECSRKEKLQNFHHISESLASPSMFSSENYGRHFSSGISVLLLFCEDLDSVVRMSAEENLNKIIRSVENTRLSRVLLDLYNEIKKNGNQKSLRICLNLFAYYCPRMKEKTVKWYALKLLPCLQVIARRKETLLLETLSEFVKCFSEHLQICLNDNETMKLIEIFLSDIVSDCAVKRRCSAQSCIYLLKGSRNKEVMAKKILTKTLDYLQKGDLSVNTVVGVFGFLRLLLPIIVSSSECESKQIIEVYDLCLHFLNNCNHSIINASLEVINAILSGLSPELKEVFINNGIHQNDFLKKRKSLKNQIFQLRHAEMTCSASASASVTSTMISSTIADKDKGCGDGAGLNQQQGHASGKSSTETIKDAFKSRKKGWGDGDGTDEQLTGGVSGIDAGHIMVEDAGQDSVSSSSTNEIKINDESTTIGGSSTPTKFCKVVVDNVDDGSDSMSLANANKMTSTSTSSTLAALPGTITTVPQINEPQEEGYLHSSEDKSQILSDVDNESFNSIDFESEITIGIGNDGIDYELKEDKENKETGDRKSRERNKEKDEEKADVKSIKSADSIGAFFNNLLSHSNAETMTKLFRPSTKTSAAASTDHPSSSPSSSSSASRLKAKQTSDTGGTESKSQPTMKYTSRVPMTLVTSSGGGVGNLGMATLTLEDDAISLESINSHISLGSHVSQQSRNEQDLMLAAGNDSEIEGKSDRAVWYEVVEASLVDQEPQTSSQETRGNEITLATSTKANSQYQGDRREFPQSPRKGDYSDVGSSNVFDDAANLHLKIGKIYEQNIIDYTVRLIASKFLLSGVSGGLLSDTVVRVSIKSLSLAVLASCIELKPEVLHLPLELDREEAIPSDVSPDTSNENSSGSISASDFYSALPTEDLLSEKLEAENPPEENLLEIKDDHFGECTNPYLFDSVLSKSADQALLAPLKNTLMTKELGCDGNNKKNDSRSKLNQQLEQILSKSEIIESKSHTDANMKQHPWSHRMQKIQSASMGCASPLKKSLLFDTEANQDIETEAREQKELHPAEHKKLDENKMDINTPDWFAAKTDMVNPASTTPPDCIQLHYHQSGIHKGQEHYHDGERQFIHDIFLYSNHSDPVLRGNMQMIACNFAKACLTGLSRSGESRLANMMQSEERGNQTGSYGWLDIDKLLHILLKGFQDEIHTVIIQALTFFDKIFGLLMWNYYIEQKRSKDKGDEKMIDADNSNDNKIRTENFFDKSPELMHKGRITPKLLLNQLELCFANRYWLVQNKYADVVSNLDFEAIQEYYDDDMAVIYEDIFLQQLLQLLGDDDARVRDHVAACLCDYIRKKPIVTMDKMKGNEFDRKLLEEFLMQRVFRGMSESLCEVLKGGRFTNEKSCSLLSRVLFLLTNKLMDLDKKNMQLGIINTIRVLLSEFNPIDHLHVWNEFNILEICICFMIQNLTTAMDIHVQIGLIDINTKLLSANLLSGNNVHPPQLVDNLCEHVMRILSIYYYLFSSQKPPMLSTKTQKTELLFANVKDSSVHHVEDLSSDYLYVKLYGVLKAAYGNYKISTNQDSGNKFMSLVATCLRSLSALLEFKQNTNGPSSSVKLIEDILQYLTVIVNYSPIETINCLRQLLKFLFCRNYGNRKVEYENFLKLYFVVRNCGWQGNYLDTDVDKVAAGNVLEAAVERKCGDCSQEKSALGGDDERRVKDRKDFVCSGDRFNLSELFASAISFPLSKSKLEEDCAKHIKLFERLVIYCLTLFMKSNAVVQSAILDMLSELLDYNVTYSILDSKNIIFDQVENNIEIIENGTARNSKILIQSMIRFLVKLTKQCDRKLISIPKIISITNNLFTNNALRECSVIALRELAFEMFFKHPNSPERSSNLKEMNAEREVILRMLEQYIDSIDCQKMLAILLLWARAWKSQTMSPDEMRSVTAVVASQDPESVPKDTSPESPTESLSVVIPERAILSIIVGALQIDAITANTSETYFVLDAIFANCDKGVILTSDLFEPLLELFVTKNVENLKNLSHAVIILDNVILKTEEIYLLNHVKLLFSKNNIQLDCVKSTPDGSKAEFITASSEQLGTCGSQTAGYSGGIVSVTNIFDGEINYFVKVLYSMLETSFSTSIERSYDADYISLTSKYIRLVTEVAMKFEKMRDPLRTLLTRNNTVYEKLETSPENLEQVRVDILTLLCELCLGRDEGDSSSSNSSSFCLTLQPRSILQCIQKIKKTNGQKVVLNRVFEKFKDINWWMTEDIKVLLSVELLQAFLAVETKLKRALAEHPTYCRVLMERLLLLPRSFCKNILHSILDLISKVNINASLLKLKFLWSLFVDDSSVINRSSQKLIQLHFDNELQSLKSRLQRGDCKEYCSTNNDAVNILKEISTSGNGLHFNKLSLSTQNTLERLLRLFINGGRLKNDDAGSIECSYERLDDGKVSEFQQEINEKWLIQQVINISSHSDSKALAKVLMDFKSEIKLKTIFNAETFCSKDILAPCLDVAFHTMITSFQNNCVQYNPHINYMNINPLLRVTLQTFLRNLQFVIDQEDHQISLENLAIPTLSLMKNLRKLENISLLYIQLPAIEKFVHDQLLKSQVPIEKLLIEYGACVASHLKEQFNSEMTKGKVIRTETHVFLECVDEIFKQKFVWVEINKPQKYEKHLNVILDMLHAAMTNAISNTIFYKQCWLQQQGAELTHFDADGEDGYVNKDTKDVADSDNQSLRMRKVIFLAKLMECSLNGSDNKVIYSRQSMDILKSLTVTILRTSYYYGLAVVPYELFQTLKYDTKGCSYAKLPSIPVDHLSDLDTLQKFIRRLSFFGFSTRQQFEEYFMTFLLLINRKYDANMVDEQEQFLIKDACLTVIMELLIMCKTFPVVGNKVSKFHHSIRWQRIKCRNNISLKKLHKIQLIIPGSNVFYHPNLERDLSVICHDSIIGTNYFLPNQYELNHVWQQMEPLSNEGLNMSSGGITTGGLDRASGNIGLGDIDEIKEDTSGIDLKSSCQLIFDVFTQIIEHNHMLVLPNLVKFCEICDNREHIRWIKNTVMRLQEQIPFDDTISHHYIIYLLCRTQSILVPSFAELSHLCSIISTYLKSTHIFIRNATLHGLLCLLECCSKTSTTLGKLSEELCLLREIIVGYIAHHGIIDESSTMFSDMHTKLVWTLNFSLIEMTTKFVPECHLLSNTIISANNLLKRTTNEAIYLCIIHGLERIMVVSTPQKPFCDKIEKLALELVKVENERFSLPALKLLLSCVYIGSSKQLETTEHSNGIVQDDPEIIAQQTEKVDVLLHRIKSSTSSAARIYGEVLCQIVRDLVPPNEILTKVIKEFLAINQPHCEVIARIVYQVFRSCIDSSFLRMLQDWLICSLPNFLTLPPENGVWCLTIIFLSSSINLDLIKLFPFALNNSKVFGDIKTLLFIISARDFYIKLNTEQKTRFRDIFKNCELDIYIDMLKCL